MFSGFSEGYGVDSGGASVKVKPGHRDSTVPLSSVARRSRCPSPVPGMDRALKPIEERRNRSPGTCPGSPGSGSATGCGMIWLDGFCNV